MLLTLQSELGSKAVHENSLLIKSTLFGSPIFSDSVGFELFLRSFWFVKKSPNVNVTVNRRFI